MTGTPGWLEIVVGVSIMAIIVVNLGIIWTHGRATMNKYGGKCWELVAGTGWTSQWRWLQAYGRVCREHGVSLWRYRFVLVTTWFVGPALVIVWVVLGFLKRQ